MREYEFVNLTPHAIVLNNGTVFPPSGSVARVVTTFKPAGIVGGIQCYAKEVGEVGGIPDPKPLTRFIVSAMVLDAVTDRDDLVAPSTGIDSTVRNDKGHIVSVEGFIVG